MIFATKMTIFAHEGNSKKMPQVLMINKTLSQNIVLTV
jgi:hypothetical protein